MKHDNLVDGDFNAVDVICGADMFFYHQYIEEAGFFDENIFLYGEEGELQYRMKKAGIDRYIIPNPQICHLVGKSMEESLAKRVIFIKSHFYILKKHMAVSDQTEDDILYHILFTDDHPAYVVTDHRQFPACIRNIHLSPQTAV